MTAVLALDPGERVGWARTDVDEHGNWTNSRHGITPLKDMACAIYNNVHDYDVVVCEDWRLRPGMERTFIGSAFPAVQFIGMVRLCCWQSLRGTKLQIQQPAAKAVAMKTMKRLHPAMFELVTKPVAHDDGHDQDAILHLWYWTVQHTEVARETLAL